jgi:TMEM175 potassium channel family protein
MMPDVDRKSVEGLHGPERVIALSDGVYAIALTLLILDIRLPELPQPVSSQEFEVALLALQPQLFSYALSFAVIGIFWLAHHRYFRYIKRVDSTLSVLNLLSLFWVAFIPFPTALVGQYAPSQALCVVRRCDAGYLRHFHRDCLLQCGSRHVVVVVDPAGENRGQPVGAVTK